ncbi:hypothetical protein DM01DRAFT_257374 [Hesseltinella vesiculosa]|uniref:RNI-like protein n=1 Tax=Hesseltinella vesiculosa TaxID=101127 RepID=A0A1X2GEL7_9FUNG|nr:hypothetical protein DM01DRAFT_257374 [Hesseltinella vesiculosa]
MCQQQLVEVKEPSDLSKVESCKSVLGSILISSPELREVHLNNLKDIQGDLVFRNASEMTWIDAPNLQSVGGALRVETSHSLGVLSLPKLTSAQTVVLNDLPSLKTLTFPGGLTHINHLYMTDTGISKVEGLDETSMEDISIAGNLNLNTLDLSKLQQVDKSMYFSNNGGQFQLDLSGLKAVDHATFEVVKDIRLDMLDRVKGDLYFLDNFFDRLALPNVTVIGGALTVANNTKIQHLAVPQLSRIDGALTVSNNRMLTAVDAFPKLEQVQGSVNLAGAFDDIFLPKLGDVKGGFNAKSSSEKFSCNNINSLKQQEIIKGHSFSCQKVDDQQVFAATTPNHGSRLHPTLLCVALLPLLVLQWY